MTALWEFYDLPPGNWEALARRLIENHVPAFMTDTRGRAKSAPSEEERTAYIELGGKPDPTDDGLTAFVRACFVQSIENARRQKKSYHEACKALLGRAEIPSQYRNIKKASALHEAFKQTPWEIRDNPARFIPGTRDYQQHQEELAEAERRIEEEFRKRRR